MVYVPYISDDLVATKGIYEISSGNDLVSTKRSQLGQWIKY